jgi:predicted transcriptional regulator
MSSSTDAAVPVLIRMPPNLLARIDRIADQQERSRTWLMKRAAAAYCDVLESSAAGSEPATAAADTPGSHAPGALAAAISSLPRAGASSCAADGGRVSEVVEPGPAAASYPSALHVKAVRRAAAVHDERAETAKQHRNRVAEEVTQSLKDLT